MTLDPWLLAAAVIGLAGIAVWWVWALNRDTNKRIDTLAATTRNNSGAIIQLQTAATGLPTTTTAPMNNKIWSGSMASISMPTAAEATANLIAGCRQVGVDPDQTLRLGPPPSLARIGELCQAAGLTPPREALARIAAIEQHLAAGRPCTRMELARTLDLQPWEISADLHSAVLARIITTGTSHTAGEAVYQLCDPTVRMGRMSVLPGVNR